VVQARPADPDDVYLAVRKSAQRGLSSISQSGVHLPRTSRRLIFTELRPLAIERREAEAGRVVQARPADPDEARKELLVSAQRGLSSISQSGVHLPRTSRRLIFTLHSPLLRRYSHPS
jgi:hypothetical protein